MPVIAYRPSMKTVRNAKVVAKRKIAEVEKCTSQKDDSSSSSSYSESSDEYDEEFSSNSSPGRHENVSRRTTKRRKKITRSNGAAEEKEEEEEIEKDEDEFYVQSIIDMKVEGGKRFFFVKWLDWPEDANSWEPEENVTGCNDMIADFIRKREAIRTRKTRIEQNKNSKRESDVKSGSYKKGASSKIPIGSNCKGTNNQSRVTFAFRIWVDEEQQVQLLYLDTEQPWKEEYYSVVLTEDLHGKDPKWFFGAAEGQDGSTYYLVQFEGSEYIDVVTPVTLLDKFPYVKTYYDTMDKKVA